MKKYIFQLFLLSSPLLLMAQVGTTFPYMETENLSEVPLILPENIKGKFSILALAMSKKSEDELNTWYDPTYRHFIKKPEKEEIFATEYDINLYFIPMISGHQTIAYKGVMEKFRQNINSELYPHVLFYKGNIKEYSKSLKLKSKKEPYFFLLNREGEIVWSTSGYYSRSKMQEIINILDKNLRE